MQRHLRAQRTASAFTLIEILVVGLLIAILSAIGLISVRTFMERNGIRVVLGETHQIATALSLCRDDIGFYPKINFLLYGENQIGERVGDVDATTNPIRRDFALYGADIADLTPRIVQNWSGPYIGMSGGRRGIGGPSIVTMELPNGVDDPGTPNNEARVEFPGDRWNMPYAVYVMSIDGDGLISFNTGERASDPNVPSPADFRTVPNFFTAVVSYGPNQVPGSQTPPAAANLPTRADQEAARLFTVLDTRSYIYRALEQTDYNTADRINGYFAIVDPASDDLVRQF